MKIDQILCTKYLYKNDTLWTFVAQYPETEPLSRWKSALWDAVAQQNILIAHQICQAALDYVAIEHPEQRGIMLAGLIASCLPQAIKRMEACGYSSKVIHDTFSDFGYWAALYHDTYGVYGVGELPWLLLPFCGRIVRLGRMQFEYVGFPYPYYIFEEHETGRLLALITAGQSITAQGLIVGTNNSADPAILTTTVTRSGDYLCGYAADSNAGTLITTPIELDLRRYTLLLAPQQPVLNIHIPAIGPLTNEAVRDSLQQAASLAYAGRVAICESWLLDPQLEQFVACESNLSLFAKRFSRMPVLAHSGAARYVFGEHFDPDHLAACAENSHLQRCLKQLYLRGGQTFDVCGVLRLSDA